MYFTLFQPQSKVWSCSGSLWKRSEKQFEAISNIQSNAAKQHTTNRSQMKINSTFVRMHLYLPLQMLYLLCGVPLISDFAVPLRFLKHRIEINTTRCFDSIEGRFIVLYAEPVQSLKCHVYCASGNGAYRPVLRGNH